MKKREINLTTLIEDPYFDLNARNRTGRFTMRGGRGSVDNRNIRLGKIPGDEPEEAPKPQTGAPSATTAPTATPQQQQDQQAQPAADPAAMRTTVQKAEDDVDAAQKVFGEEKKAPPKKPVAD